MVDRAGIDVLMSQSWGLHYICQHMSVAHIFIKPILKFVERAGKLEPGADPEQYA
jgi:hypothetical protein